MANVAYDSLPKHHTATKGEKLVIGASSLGTVFEWYDFYLYGSLATYIASHFFAGVNSSLGFILALAAFAAGFAVRPFGAIVFGRIGDVVGRKNTFLVTMAIMGLSTFVVGLLPGYDQIGVAAPIILVSLRLLQGLALGGEYGGAATYVAEHAPDNKRGLYTSWIQTTATMGLFASLLVIMATRSLLSPDDFSAWGWRVPFLISMVLLAVSIWIRLQLNESPVFQKMKEEGTHSTAPLKEAFLRWGNLKVVLVALFAAVAGQAVVWYTGQFYALFFLTKTLGIEAMQANTLIAISLLIGTPFFIVFGWLSDKIGRKPIIMAGCALAVFTYFPIFNAMTEAGNPALAQAMRTAPVTIVADPADCHFQFAPGELREHITYRSSCDLARSALAGRSVSYDSVDAPAGSVAQIRVGDVTIASFDGQSLEGDAFRTQSSTFGAAVNEAINAAGYPASADPEAINTPLLIGLLALLVIYVTMVYGPIAAMLVELFPTRIRYTSMSLPYHIGNGWFGGFLPTTAFAIVAATGNIYSGLWYPVGIAAMTLVLGLLFLPETRTRNIDS
jgi:MFS family permease